MALVILAVVQAILLIVLLGAVFVLLQRIQKSARQIDELTESAVKILTEDVRPAISDIRRTLEKIERVAEGAGVAITAVEPVVRGVSQVAGRFQKASSPLWVDLACLAIDIWGIMRKRRSRQRPSGVAGDQPIT
ncbi:MAG: hypothetical protein K6T17_05000 [Fimbriimonadales bacterium]|nr:hypothetical protein [Fimbriimonadales bacterium]